MNMSILKSIKAFIQSNWRIKRVAEAERYKLLADFSNQSLITLCTDHYKNVIADQVIFGYSNTEVQKVLEKNELSISTPMDIITKSITNPMILDHIASQKNNKILSKFNLLRKNKVFWKRGAWEYQNCVCK